MSLTKTEMVEAIGSGKDNKKEKEIVEISSEEEEFVKGEVVGVGSGVCSMGGGSAAVGAGGSGGKAASGLDEKKYRKDEDDEDDDIVFIESVFKGDFKEAKPKQDHQRSSTSTNLHNSSPDVVFVSQKRIVIPFGRTASSTVNPTPPPIPMDFSICYGMLASRLINVNCTSRWNCISSGFFLVE